MFFFVDQFRLILQSYIHDSWKIFTHLNLYYLPSKWTLIFMREIVVIWYRSIPINPTFSYYGGNKWQDHSDKRISCSNSQVIDINLSLYCVVCRQDQRLIYQDDRQVLFTKKRSELLSRKVFSSPYQGRIWGVSTVPTGPLFQSEGSMDPKENRWVQLRF